ncbi:O-antigen ligase family protein [Sunxiuqinia sp. A32]|uniref:O-antigen ligase family protein n=1 Tax=Sunxiuqinia sp. A32 TaxID=3461496 RepID=UPI0040460E26
MAKPEKLNWFYLALLVFAVALPFSEGLISTSIGLLLLASLFSTGKNTILLRINDRKVLLFPISVFFVYVIWLVSTNDWNWALYDLKKNLSYLIIPFAFIISPTITNEQHFNVLKLFALAVFSSALITITYFNLQDESSLLQAQHYGFIHHIRFSFQLILSMGIILYLLLKEFLHLKIWYKLLLVVAICFLFVFLVWHQSLTGMLAFLGTAFFAIFFLSSKMKGKWVKRIFYFCLILLVLVPTSYLVLAINSFYSGDEFTIDELEQKTENGNLYSHDTENKVLENGNYVWLYVCEKELAIEWNKRSEIDYYANSVNGYSIRQTLIRYLTSKGFRKDAEGVKKLSEEDIKNIEKGISNYIFARKGISLYPRVYMSIWEIDTYIKTGFANQRSLAQRIEYTRAALTIIKDNFWFGVGTGNWKKAYAEAYEKNQSKMDPARYGDAHNQYLNYIVKFGIIGFILIMFLLMYPVLKTKAYRDPIFMVFLISLLFANFGDSNLETHVGSNFFIFFYCFFLIPYIDGGFGKSIQ